MLSKVGTPFEQGSAKIQSQYGGTGLGLSPVKRLLDGMDGQFLIESLVGKGTTVTASIPMRESSDPSKIVDLDHRGVKLQPCSTLIVDDLKSNRVVLKHFMTKFGFPVIEAESVVEAIKAFRESKPQIILLDIQMPGMDGYEVLRKIREIEAQTPTGPQCLIVAVTGLAFNDEVKKCMDSGFDGHIAKPVSKHHLEQILGKISTRKYRF